MELDELSTSTSSKNADHFPNSRSPPFVGFESNGVDNPAFDAPFENTSCWNWLHISYKNFQKSQGPCVKDH